MTIGFAATRLSPDSAGFLLAADCRYSTPRAFTDTGIKTHALDRTTGAVVAGNALSVASAVEPTRGIADDHNRMQPEKRINFHSTVRLFSFFLDQIERKSPWSEGCEVALTGFLSNGTPALAKVFTGRSRRAEAHIRLALAFRSVPGFGLLAPGAGFAQRDLSFVGAPSTWSTQRPPQQMTAPSSESPAGRRVRRAPPLRGQRRRRRCILLRSSVKRLPVMTARGGP